MICPKCKGSRMVFKRIENTVVLGRCPMCDGLGEIKGTNFQRITESPEKLAEFIHEAESVYERCAKGDLICDYCECRWCGLAGRKDLIDWLNEENKE